MLKIVLLFICSLSLFAKTNPWYSRVNTKIEAGIYLPMESGYIENIQGTSNFNKDFGYKNAKASYFSLEITHDYHYVPNLYISYFNMQDNQNATLTKAIQVANQTFDSNVLSTIDYQIFSATFYQDFQIKGEVFTLFGSKHYSGDLEFDVGVTTKNFHWHYKVKDLTNLSRRASWIKVDESIPLPYLGVKYFFYKLTLYANINDLAFNSAKSSTYHAGIEYKVTKNLYLNAAYINEEFNVIEKEDTIDFKTSGYKFSFKYAF